MDQNFRVSNFNEYARFNFTRIRIYYFHDDVCVRMCVCSYVRMLRFFGRHNLKSSKPFITKFYIRY